MARILINCPSCSEKGYIEISEGEFKNISRGLLAVNIEKDIICLHSFIAYIDKNSKVRDYFIADFQIEIPEILPLKEIEEKEIPGPDLIDIFLIKINLSATLLTYIIKSIFHNEKVAIILDDLKYRSRLKDDILNFFKYITKDSFDVDISIISKEDYKKEKMLYKEYMVFEGNKILNNVDNIINPKELKVESQIIKKFLSEADSRAGLLILKNENQKVYNLAESITEFLNNYEEKHNLHLKLIIDHLAKVYNIVLSKTHLDLVIEIANNYFGADISEFCRVSDFLSFLE